MRQVSIDLSNFNILEIISSFSPEKHFCVLNSNSQSQFGTDKWNKQLNKAEYDYLLAIGSIDNIEANSNCLQSLDAFRSKHKSKWMFGYISYDVKNESAIGGEELNSANKDGLQFPLLHFFVPEYLIEAKDGKGIVHFQSSNVAEEKVNSFIQQLLQPETQNPKPQTQKSKIENRNSKQEYISAINQLKQHIQQGDIYEVNYCMEFFAEQAVINPVGVYQKLNELTQAPFSAFYKNDKHYAICGSPERFIKKKGDKIISQPIKGTAKRSGDAGADEQLKRELHENQKERSENVMIVDLVRNDLSKIAQRASVNVDELFGVYTFKSVHQLISTISAELKPDTSFIQILKALFPMGSMTGAPKIRAMQLIEQYEKTKRGLYSGSIGYIKPNGDFDFNVVIRSILYNETNRYLSFMVGSAITANCEAEKEYEECLLKAEAMALALK